MFFPKEKKKKGYIFSKSSLRKWSIRFIVYRKPQVNSQSHPLANLLSQLPTCSFENQPSQKDIYIYIYIFAMLLDFIAVP